MQLDGGAALPAAGVPAPRRGRARRAAGGKSLCNRKPRSLWESRYVHEIRWWCRASGGRCTCASHGALQVRAPESLAPASKQCTDQKSTACGWPFWKRLPDSAVDACMECSEACVVAFLRHRRCWLAVTWARRGGSLRQLNLPPVTLLLATWDVRLQDQFLGHPQALPDMLQDLGAWAKELADIYIRVFRSDSSPSGTCRRFCRTRCRTWRRGEGAGTQFSAETFHITPVSPTNVMLRRRCRTRCRTWSRGGRSWRSSCRPWSTCSFLSRSHTFPILVVQALPGTVQELEMQERCWRRHWPLL